MSTINPVNSGGNYTYATQNTSKVKSNGDISFANEQKMKMMQETASAVFDTQAKKSVRNNSEEWQTAIRTKGGGFRYPSDDFFRQIKSIIDDGSLITPEMVSEAQANIADGGYWGSEAVSDRLVNAALKMANGDEGKYEMFKNAIEAGYKAAADAWGGNLPDICRKTYDMTMKKLEEAFKPKTDETTKTENA